MIAVVARCSDWRLVLWCEKPVFDIPLKGDHPMKLGQLALLIAIAIPVGAAADTKKPVAKWTCADFLGVEDAFRPKLIYWATAQAKADKPEVAMINIEGTEKVIPIIVEDCKKAPQDSFWQKLEAGWKRVEADMKSLEKKL
jgi:acid stress chaperone HdeA